MRLCFFVAVLLLNLHPGESRAADQPSSSNPAAFVRALLDASDVGTSFAELQLAIDKSIDLGRRVWIRLAPNSMRWSRR